MKVVHSFTIVVAEPLFLDGHRETFITVSNYFSENFGDIFSIILDSLRAFGNVSGGKYQPGSAFHAERLMVERLKNTSDLGWPQAIPGSVSGEICSKCQYNATDTSTPGQIPGFVFYDIDNKKGITLILFAPGLSVK